MPLPPAHQPNATSPGSRSQRHRRESLDSRNRRTSAPLRRRVAAAGVWAAVGVVVVAMGAATSTAATAAPEAHPIAGDTVIDNAVVGDAAVGNAVATAALTSARSLADGVPGTAIVSPAVADDLGYAPVLEHSLAAKATGDCSSPVPLPAAFEPACRVHDLSYDLLRVAHRHGAAIPAGLRSDLDSLLGRQMRDSCEGDPACTVMADVARAAVGLNTLRQGHGAPVEESLPW